MRKAEVEEVVMGLGLRSLECEVKVASDLENLGEKAACPDTLTIQKVSLVGSQVKLIQRQEKRTM